MKGISIDLPKNELVYSDLMDFPFSKTIRAKF